MNRYDRLLQLLKKEFPAAAIELTDDSVEHAGHAHGHDGETHYRVKIRDAGFAGLTRLQMHRKIIAAVQSEMDAGHAHGGARVGDARPALSAVEGDGIGSPMHSFVIEDCGT